MKELEKLLDLHTQSLSSKMAENLFKRSPFCEMMDRRNYLLRKKDSSCTKFFLFVNHTRKYTDRREFILNLRQDRRLKRFDSRKIPLIYGSLS